MIPFRPGKDVDLMEVYKSMKGDDRSIHVDGEQAAEIEALMAEDQEVARFVDALVGKLAEQLKPGMGPMVIPPELVAVVREAAPWTGQYRWPLPASHELWLVTTLGTDGCISLTLEFDGRLRVWEGVLRPGTWPGRLTERKPR